ncbi:MAG: B12-binding domain-containing radical SAM protein [Candidatus Thiodiazotropha sp. (ex Dulcina madagascariensis)]|nr:B12-binding domain-containing radical SAM protein [Candidatus Thiodiazotropha sp. (ex Dulcina madagascariensis)]
MKILCVNPRYGGPDGLIILPLDLASCVAYARNHDLSVSVVDLAFRPDDSALMDAVRSDRPDYILFTAITVCYRNAVAAASSVKALFPGIPIGIMGEHVSFRKSETLQRHPAFDHVLSFESEETLVELAQALKTERSLSSVLGLTYRKDWAIHNNPDRSPERDLSRFPIPARRDFDIDEYRRRDHETTLVTARGCRYQCKFCHRSRYGRRLRYWPLDSVFREIEDVLDMGFSAIFFQDDIFCADKSRVRAICDWIIERDLTLAWNCNVRVDDFDPRDPADAELLDLMKRAGCYRFFTGIETMNQSILDLSRKKSQSAGVLEYVRFVKAHGIQIHASYVIGLPGETETSVRDTVSMAIELDTDIASFNRIFPHPGTPIGDTPSDIGSVVPDPLWYEGDEWIDQAVAGNQFLSPAKVQQLQQDAIDAYITSRFEWGESERS